MNQFWVELKWVRTFSSGSIAVPERYLFRKPEEMAWVLLRLLKN